MAFAAPDGAKLEVGNYPGATRYPFQKGDSPGLDFDANGAGSNALTGQFQVLEISFDPEGNLATFAANFVEHGEGHAEAGYGEIRYHSSVPYLTPTGVGQLAASKYRVLGTAGSLVVTATRRAGSTGPLSVNYSTADGTDLAGRDYQATSGTLAWADGDTANKTFTVPILNPNNPTQGDGVFVVNLSGAGTGAQTQAVVTVVNDNSSVTFVHFDSEQDDYIGQGKERTFSIADGFVLTPSRYNGGVSISFDNRAAANLQHSEGWEMNFAAPLGTIFGVGNYENAELSSARDGEHSTLDIFGNGRGPSKSKGSFRVLEAQFAHDGSVLKFAADFEQYNDGNHGLSLRGQVRYNSTVPLPPPPEPTPTPTPAETPPDAAATPGPTSARASPPASTAPACGQ